MKRKLSLRFFLLTALVAMSISSFVFLSLELVAYPVSPTSLNTLELYEEHSETPNHKPLPDLEIFLKLLEIGKRFMPAN